MAPIKPYTIHIPDSKLTRLQQKLSLTDFPTHELEDAGWKYGTPISDIKTLHEYWVTKFSWREKEAEMNKLPNFKTQVEVEGFGELDVHFLHQKSEGKGAVPLLFVHGWPGSFLEVVRMLPFLKGGEGKPAFDVVAPSLPNYCFSGGVKKQGFEIKQYAETCHKLMLALGYDEYVTQGGDWGFLITRALAHLYPQSVKATHINWIFASPPPPSSSSTPPPSYTPRELSALSRGQEWFTGDGRGYLAIQSTKPSTLAFSFSDSPAALLAWIYEKLVGWSDGYKWSEEEVLTWVCLYWFSEAGPEASSYHYYEAMHGSVITVDVVQRYIDVPLGVADFPVEIANSPRAWWRGLGPIVFEKSYEKGGHFAGWERPGDLAEGLCEMFGKGGGAYGVVKGRDGY